MNRASFVGRTFLSLPTAARLPWLACCLVPLAALAEPIDLGTPTQVMVPGQENKVFEVEVAEAGVLTVVTRGAGGDLVLTVTDTDSQPLPDGQTDMDAGGNLPDEQLVTILPFADTWLVSLHNMAEDASNVTLVVGFVPFPPVAREPDPNGRPTKATPLEVGKPVEDSLSTADFDIADWYAITPEEDGRLVIFTEGDDELDIVLSVVAEDALDQPIAESDQDLEGSTSNEGLIVPVKAGRTYYLKVSALVDTGGKYKLGSTVVAF